MQKWCKVFLVTCILYGNKAILDWNVRRTDLKSYVGHPFVGATFAVAHKLLCDKVKGYIVFFK